MENFKQEEMVKPEEIKREELKVNELAEKIGRILKGFHILDGEYIPSIPSDELELKVESMLYTMTVCGLSETIALVSKYGYDYIYDYFPFHDILEDYYNVDEAMEIVKIKLDVKTSYEIYILAFCREYEKMRENDSHQLYLMYELLYRVLLKIGEVPLYNLPDPDEPYQIEDEYKKRFVEVLEEIL